MMVTDFTDSREKGRRYVGKGRPKSSGLSVSTQGTPERSKGRGVIIISRHGETL